ncbi:hypothetical protein ACTXT7_012789 [Hymenolepis weldensis]
MSMKPHKRKPKAAQAYSSQSRPFISPSSSSQDGSSPTLKSTVNDLLQYVQHLQIGTPYTELHELNKPGINCTIKVKQTISYGSIVHDKLPIVLLLPEADPSSRLLLRTGIKNRSIVLQLQKVGKTYQDINYEQNRHLLCHAPIVSHNPHSLVLIIIRNLQSLMIMCNLVLNKDLLKKKFRIYPPSHQLLHVTKLKDTYVRFTSKWHNFKSFSPESYQSHGIEGTNPNQSPEFYRSQPLRGPDPAEYGSSQNNMRELLVEDNYDNEVEYDDCASIEDDSEQYDSAEY